jgi:translocation and assembly module TamA
MRRAATCPGGPVPALAAAVLALALPLAPAAARAAEKVEVRVEGLRGELKKNALANIDLEELRKDKSLDEGRIRRLYAQGPEEIEDALQPFGYYHAAVRSSLDHQNGTWVATFKVDAGPPLKVGTVDFQVLGPGAADPGFTGLRASFPLHAGDTLVQPAYQGGKQALEGYAAAHGYLDAKYTASEIRVDLGRYTSDVVLHFETGPRYLFGPVNFHQNFLHPNLLKGYVEFKQGEPLDADKLLKLQNALSSASYFQRVEVVPRRDRAQGLEVPIEVNLTAAKRQRWTAGLGYGTDTGPRVSAGLDVRRVNSRGHRADVQVRVSDIEKSFQTDYYVPGAYPRTDLLTYKLGYADLDTQTSKSRSFVVGPGYSRSLGRWRESFGLDFTRTTFTVGTDAGISHLLTPTASWNRVFADDRIYPSHGERVQLDLAAAERSVLSNATFGSAHASAKFIQSFGGRPTFGGRRFRFLTRAELGYLATSTSDFHKLPPTERFFAGGDQSVRGYSYQGIGLRDVNGHVIGGTRLAVASVEVEYRFLQKWGLATFYDAGSASDRLLHDLRAGTGVGVRWLSPIGMIRLDAAVAIDEPGHPKRLHFSIGPDL